MNRSVTDMAFDIISSSAIGGQKIGKFAIGCNLPVEDFQHISSEINRTIIDKIYTPVEIYTDNKFYYIVDDNGVLVFGGQVDMEGTIATIEKDLDTLTVMYNFIIAMVRKDGVVLMDILKNDITTLMSQYKKGMGYIAQNKEFHNEVQTQNIN